MKNFGKIVKFLVCLIFISNNYADEIIQVYKNGVLHKFVRTGELVDGFIERGFQNWEYDTFEVFDKVKDDHSIAIDLGAWIGTTSIWLSKNFYHVIVVEGDRESLKCLQRNLEASECANVSVCNKPVSGLAQEVIYGTRGETLNESISCIKTKANHISDYLTPSITFKQLVFDYIYANENLHSHKIGFIKCDIEGGEEDILEDVLHFAYNNKCKVYISFHLDWWNTKKIDDFSYLFKYFTTNCPIADVCEYIKQQPFSSLLFEPLEDAGVLVKNNMTALIIGYNQITYIKDMVKQLEKYTSDIVVVDNASDFPPLLNYYANDFKYTLLRQKTNRGHTVFEDDSIQKLMGDIYILTDPDLKFNPDLPDTFIKDLVDISNYYNSFRTGFALCIDADDLRTDINISGEKNFWKNRLIYPPNPFIELYRAELDTTFSLVNRRNHYRPGCGGGIRIAGNFTCIHRPWHKNYRDELEAGEFESYCKNNISGSYFFKRN